MANEYLEKLRSIGTLSEDRKQKTKRWTHKDDHSGSYQTDHWDGRRDVNIRFDPIVVTNEHLGQAPKGPNK